ncbi:FxSxx-COOH system tetratricopeptide repeat protein [Phreatobacter sp.]|uniref:FxSxx-COOH system tetratricopeptide repeat protein n=1 Tax=Phreatobacter sp. TaxID=1966341 RepID=UPI003F6FDD43
MATRFFSMTDDSRDVRSAAASPRVALLVGAGAYPGGRLANPPRDIALVSAALKPLGFDVELLIDPAKTQLETAMVRFAQRLEQAGAEGIGFFYFAGHGIQFRGANYLVPVDAQIPETRYLRSGAVPVDYLVAELSECRPLATVIVVDACRNNDIRASEGGLTQGLGAVEHLPDGTILVFSTAAGEVAEDGEAGNSPYAMALSGRLAAGGHRLDEIFLGVAGDVAAMTGNRQRPAVFLQGAIAPVVLKDAPAGEAPGFGGPMDRRPPPNAVALARPSEIAPAVQLFANVPPRDLNFTGREAGLAALHDAVGPQADAIGQAVTHGMAGIGKTSFAAEYAYRHREAFSGVWWAPAEQRELLVDSLATLAVTLDPALAAEADRERQVLGGFKRLAQMTPPFLLVFDNVDSPEIVRNLTPPAGVRLVMTSRWADWGGRAAEIDLQIFEPDAAAEFLQKRAGRDDPVGARRLAAAVGHLPLALDHAGAYCRATATSFGGYSEKIDARVQRAPKGVAYPASIAATFGMAIDKATLEQPAAEDLLGLFAHMAPERIPLDLVSDAVMDEDDRAEALAALFAVSLVEHDQFSDGAPAINLHRLIQAAMRVRLADQGRAEVMADRVIAALACAFPDNAHLDPGLWRACGRLMPHVLATRELARWSTAAEPAAAILFHRAGRYLFGRGAYRDAEPFYRQAIAIGEAGAGRDDPEVGRRINDLAQLIAAAGRFDEAEPLFREVIASGEARLGRQHLDVAIRLNNLARLLNDTGRREEAEPLYREAIAINDAAAGSNSIHAVAWRNNLGILLNEAGRNDEAEPVYREAIAIGERRLGHRHHEVARCFNNLGRVLWRAGRLDEAEAMARESLAISVESLGPDHPIYARQQHSLAQILTDAGRTAEALETVAAALKVHEATLGETHPWTRDSALTFVELARVEGQPDSAADVAGRLGLETQDAG